MSTFPFVVGCRRSGLSLLRVMYACHPLVAVPPQASFAVTRLPTAAAWSHRAPFDATKLVEDLYKNDDFRRWDLPRAALEVSFRDEPPATHADAVRQIYQTWARRQGKTRYIDITAANSLNVDTLSTLFPEARIVHLVRDGRDVGASLMELGWVTGLEDAALYWRHQVTTIRRSLGRLPPTRWHEMRYEDLVRSPEATLRTMCDAIDLPFHRAMLDYRGTAATLVRAAPQPHHYRFLTHPLMPGLRDWRRDVPPRAVDRFDALAGDLLHRLAYELRPPRRPLRTKLAAQLRRPGWRRRTQVSHS